MIVSPSATGLSSLGSVRWWERPGAREGVDEGKLVPRSRVDGKQASRSKFEKGGRIG